MIAKCRSMVIALLATVTTLTAACALPNDMPGLAGTYVMSKTWAADTLHLRADGHYVRTFRDLRDSAVAPTFTDSGSWFLTRNHRSVGLKRFPPRWAFVHDLMGDTTRGKVLEMPRTLSLTVQHSWRGMLRLAWHPEFGWWFVRVGH